MISSVGLSPEDILLHWHRVAEDYDYLSAVPEVNHFFSSRYWIESDFQNVLQGFSNRKKDHETFHQHFPYSWTTERKAYEFSIDSLYQLYAIDVLAGIWHESDEATKKFHLFDNVCVRQTRRWGGPADISPRAVPQSKHNPVKFILVPYGWDNVVSMAIEGFADYAPELFEHPLSELPSQNIDPTSYDIQRAYPYLKSLAVCSLVSILGCPEVLVSAAHDRLIKEVESFLGGRLHLPGYSELNRRLSYAQAVIVYSIAHEVGHHLQGIYPNAAPDRCEYIADTLAYQGLWNYPSSIGSVCPPGEEYDALTVLAGGLFASLIDLGIESDRVTRELVLQIPQKRSPLIANRKYLWLKLTETIVSKRPELEQDWRGIQIVLAGFDQYRDEYISFLSRIISESLTDAKRCIAEFVEDNPNLDDPDEIIRSYRHKMGG